MSTRYNIKVIFCTNKSKTSKKKVFRCSDDIIFVPFGGFICFCKFSQEPTAMIERNTVTGGELKGLINTFAKTAPMTRISCAVELTEWQVKTN